MSPKISIVVATYNSSQKLAYAIKSVLASEFDDWELVIIGDCCTDDTESCVAEFDDPRVSFFNLSVNSGQQATPNNVGVERAVGEYLCFLNQDDMFLPWHLGSMLEAYIQSSADLLCARYAQIVPIDFSKSPPSIVAFNGGRRPHSQTRYDPHTSYVASCWFMRKSVAQEVGEWITESRSYITPSQEWLFRAHRMGKQILCTDRVSVIAVHSGSRPGSYSNKNQDEHKLLFNEVVTTTNQRDAVLQTADENRFPHAGRGMRHALTDLYTATLGRCFIVMGIHPKTPLKMLRYGRRGGFVKHHQRVTQSDKKP